MNSSEPTKCELTKTAGRFKVRLGISWLCLTAFVFLTGCQATTDRGLVRAWADVNSLGGAAGFIDQLRTDNFRTAPPASVLPNVEVITMHREVLPSAPQEIPVVPMMDPGGDSSGSSGTESWSANGSVGLPVGPSESCADSASRDDQIRRMSHSFAPALHAGSQRRGLPSNLVKQPTGAWLF